MMDPRPPKATVLNSQGTEGTSWVLLQQFKIQTSLLASLLHSRDEFTENSSQLPQLQTVM